MTDPDSKNLKTPRGYMQGYNVQAAVNEAQIVVAAEITSASPDFGQLAPMVEAAQRELAAAGVTDTPGVIVADAGYWHHGQIEQISAQGIPVLVPPDADKRRGTRPGWEAVPTRSCAGSLKAGSAKRSTEDARDRRADVREHEVQPRLHRFARRGRAACRSEWRLIAATHNLVKLHSALQAT